MKHQIRLCYLLALLPATSFTLGQEGAEPTAEEHPQTEEAIHLSEKAAQAYFEAITKAEAKYRESISEEIVSADKIEIYIVDFEFSEENPFDDPFETGEHAISVAPYGKKSKILERKLLNENQRANLLPILAATIAEPKHSGGALCHFPIHGLRVYKDDIKIYEGTFCWMCHNFGFKYPSGAEFLDTNKELEAAFNKLMPIPKDELERFYDQYPSARPKEEDSSSAEGD